MARPAVLGGSLGLLRLAAPEHVLRQGRLDLGAGRPGLECVTDALPALAPLLLPLLLGLCDEHIAHTEIPSMGRRRAGHEKGDGAYVLFGAARGRQKPVFRSDHELYDSARFRERYALERHRLPSGAFLWLWRRPKG